jgi:hypothetical protein
MKIINLIEKSAEPNALEKKEYIEQILGSPIPEHIFDFISRCIFTKDYFKLDVKYCKTDIDTGYITIDENKFLQYNVFSYYYKEGKQYYQWINYFIDLSRNIFLLEDIGSDMEREIMINHKILFIAEIYDDLYWAAGIGESNLGKIYFVDATNQEIIFAFNTLEDFFNSFFIGVY